MLPVAKLDYILPETLIATTPAEPRDSARLMVLRRSDSAFVQHCSIRDLPRWLATGDVLIVNNSKVIPACLAGVRADTGGKVEGLFLGVESADAPIRLRHDLVATTGRQMGAAANAAAPPGYTQHGWERWRIMLKGRRMRPGIFVGLTDAHGKPAGVSLKLIERTSADGVPHDARLITPSTLQTGAAFENNATDYHGSENDAWLVEVFACGVEASLHRRGELPVSLLERIGTAPLPPYIKAARRREDGTFGQRGHTGADAEIPRTELALRDEFDRQRYQTVYADNAAAGSVAAPTAGLHFTPELLATLARAGIRREHVVLHVGTGTFKPIETEFVEQHPMHAEWCHVPQSAGQAIIEARGRGGGRVIAVGTTSARTLESFDSQSIAAGAAGWTRLLITPGWKYQHIDGLLTNFHLPRSTLLAMVAALLPEGIDRLLRHYQDAIDRGYRFYSYGDAMLILP